MPSMANVIIGWPDRRLSPNYGDSNRFMKHKLRAEARRLAIEDCKWCVTEDWVPFSGQGRMTIIFHPKDRRRRDLDNLFSQIKQSIDGVCEVLEIDDSQLHPVALDFGTVQREKPYIEITIEEFCDTDAFYSAPVNVPTKKNSENIDALVKSILKQSPDISANEVHKRVGGNRNRVLNSVRKLKK